MRVLMFGWEFPPHISGGLGTACFGLTRALTKEDTEVLFVVPKIYGDEPNSSMLINASDVIVPVTKATRKPFYETNITKTLEKEDGKTVTEKSVATYIEVPSTLSPYESANDPLTRTSIEQWQYQLPEKHYTVDRKEIHTTYHDINEAAGVSYSFSGSYGSNLYEEVSRYAEVGGEIAKQYSFDVIHAHDWITYPAGIKASKISGKPLVIHVHATEFDRSGENVNPRVFAIEKEGMLQADCIVAVSQWTKDIIVNKYGLPAEKVQVVHNGIIPKNSSLNGALPPVGSHIVTFLGRVTHQKGPQYFVEAARKVLERFPTAHFVVAGSGDLLPQMIDRVAELKISQNFHFTGFLKGELIDKIWSMSHVYVMPSVSEPFGIAPLEAIQSGVPVIISNQSGVAEVMPHAIKADFWNIDALANAICNVLKYESLSKTLKENGTREIQKLSWDKAAQKLNSIYYELTSTVHA